MILDIWKCFWPVIFFIVSLCVLLAYNSPAQAIDFQRETEAIFGLENYGGLACGAVDHYEVRVRTDDGRDYTENVPNIVQPDGYVHYIVQLNPRVLFYIVYRAVGLLCESEYSGVGPEVIMTGSCRGDLNLDGIVLADIGILRKCFGADLSSPEWNNKKDCWLADFNVDGHVSGPDVAFFRGVFGRRCQ